MPLKRIRRGAPDIAGFNPIIYTPTFIVGRSGEEADRIIGYPVAEYFWSDLGRLLVSWFLSSPVLVARVLANFGI